MKVKFLPTGEEHEIEPNETVLHLAQKSGIHIQSVCKGLPSCAECRVRIVDGEHHVLPPSSKEVALIGTAHYIDLSRLSCQLRCFGDLTVDLTEQIEKEKRAQDKPNDRRARSDGKDSKAVLGAIMDDFKVEDVEPLEEDDSAATNDKSSGNKRRPRNNQKRKPEAKLDKRDAFYGSFYKEEGSQKSEGGNKKKSKSKNRNRNRNRNKNRKKAGGKPSQGKKSQ